MMKIGHIWLKKKLSKGKFEWFRFSLWASLYKYKDITYCSVSFSIKDNLLESDNFINFMSEKGLEFKTKPKKYVKGYMIAYYEKVYLTIPMEKMRKCLKILDNIRSRKVEIDLRIKDFDEIRSKEMARLL